jgi:uncharacterized membrane protein YciS (DUF1049 family)
LKLIGYALFIFAVLVALALGSENGHLVSINLLFVQQQISVSALVLVSALLGSVCTFLFIAIRKLVKRPNA